MQKTNPERVLSGASDVGTTETVTSRLPAGQGRLNWNDGCCQDCVCWYWPGQTLLRERVWHLDGNSERGADVQRRSMFR